MRKKLLRALCALLIAVTAALAAVPAQADARGDLYMYVETGNKGKLHLRAKPDSGSESLGLYRNGTKVLIEGFANGTWAAVLVDGRRGYMNIHYLSGYAPAVTGPAVLPAVTENTTLYVRTGNSGKLHLRANASQDADSLGLYPNGTPVHVTSRNGAWAFVNVNGAMGFMMLNYLSDSPSAASSFVQQPTPAPLSGAVTRMYVNTGNTGRLHLGVRLPTGQWVEPGNRGRPSGVYDDAVSEPRAGLGISLLYRPADRRAVCIPVSLCRGPDACPGLFVLCPAAHRRADGLARAIALCGRCRHRAQPEQFVCLPALLPRFRPEGQHPGPSARRRKGHGAGAGTVLVQGTLRRHRGVYGERVFEVGEKGSGRSFGSRIL